MSRFTTDEKRNNLARLARKLAKVPDDQFNMVDYFNNPDWSISREILRSKLYKDCNTVACAMGWGPSLRGLEKGPVEAWWNYGQRVFGIKDFSPEWIWLFDCDWRFVDNSAAGAAKRIRYYLKHNGVPDGFTNARYWMDDHPEWINEGNRVLF